MNLTSFCNAPKHSAHFKDLKAEIPMNSGFRIFSPTQCTVCNETFNSKLYCIVKTVGNNLKLMTSLSWK